MSRKLQYVLNCVGILGIVSALFGSFFVEFFYGEEPCILCFLQRASMLATGVCFWFNFFSGICIQNYAMALCWSVFGLIVALKHASLNVCRTVDSPFFILSYRLYTWSIFVFFILLLGIALLIYLYKPLSKRAPSILWLSTGALLFIALIVCFFSAIFVR